MKRVIALVGRPNVGKSTLFNRLTRSRQALVANKPGLTRDRIYGRARIGDEEFIVIDTAGITDAQAGIEAAMTRQAKHAIEEADAVLFLTDGRAGLTVADEHLAADLRRCSKPLWLVVNKVEGMDTAMVNADFHQLGLGDPVAISAEHGDGVRGLMDDVLARVPAQESPEESEAQGIKIAVAGRPNVGKSTLVNRMLGEERVLVFDEAGTTRDSIYIPFERDGQRYTLIDTAGVRRRARVEETIEKISVVKTLQAIDDAHVVILVLDARDGVTEQDASVSGFILDAGRALVIAVNKWDGLSPDQRQRVRDDIDRKLDFLDFARVYFISALHGTAVGDLFEPIISAYRSATSKHPTPALTRILEDAVSQHQPPLVRGRRIKLRYAHQGGVQPPRIIIHGNQVLSVPDAYTRYLSNLFRKVLRLEGTPVVIEYKSGENPFRGKKNVLTKRQVQKKKRLRKHVSRKGK